ncbi:unnamed protein product [Pylaiella littoralis]
MSRIRRPAALAGALVTLLVAAGPLNARAEPGDGGDAAATASFSKDSFKNIEALTRPTFISSVLESSRPALVWLYAGADCPQCENLLPVVEEAAGKLSAWGVSVAAVDVSEETKLRRDLSIPRGLPMMFKVYHSESTPNPYGGLPVRSDELITIFHDARTLQKKVLTAIPDLVVSVELEDASSGAPSLQLETALAEGGEAKFTAVLFMGAGKASSPVLRVLASQVRGKVAAVQARLPKRTAAASQDDEEKPTDKTLAGLLEGIIDVEGTGPSVPSLVLVDNESGKGTVYDGGAVDDAKAIMSFVREGAGIAVPESSTTASPDADTGDASSGSSSNAASGGGSGGPLLKLDPESLAALEEKGTEALVVAFVDEGDVDSIPGWRDATKGLQGQIRAGVFDCSAHPAECQQGSAKNKGAPHLRVYPHKRGVDGDKRGFPSVLPATQVKEAVAEAEASLPEIVTVVPPGVGSQRVQEAVQSFVGTNIFAGGSPMCLLVLSKREEPNLVVKTVSAAFQTVEIGTMFISKPDEEVLASLGLFKLPAMVLMFAQQEGMGYHADPTQPKPRDGEQAIVTASYNPTQWGPVTHDHVSQFIMNQLSSIDRDALLVHVREMAETARLNAERLPIQLESFLAQFDESEDAGSTPSSPSSSSSSSSAAAATPFQGVPEVSAEVWSSITGEGTSGGHPRTAGVFFLDRFSEGFASALRAAESAAELATARLGQASGGTGFVWADAPCQEGFAKTLGVSDASEVPVLVVFSPKHQKSARFVGAWEAESLGTFLGRALGGRAPMFPIGDEAPSLDDSVDCSQRPVPEWLSGGDAGGAGNAEEDDDMGDFMAEILAEEAKAKRELEEQVARGLEAMEAAKADEVAPKRTKKTVKKKKKKKSGSSAHSEL